MNSLKLFLYIQLIFLAITFCNCYKFICQPSFGFFRKCSLLLSVTEGSYRYAFLCIVPRELKSQLLKSTAVDRFRSVGPLVNTNFLLKRSLTKTKLRLQFNYRPRNLAGVWIFQSEIAVKNYNRKYDVNSFGKRIRKGYSGYSRMSWSDFSRNMDHNKFL